MNETWQNFRNLWVDTLCSREYDRLIRYIGITVSRGRLAVSAETLVERKQQAMYARRISAAVSGIAVGSAAVRPEFLPPLISFASAVSLAVLGWNLILDRKLDEEIGNTR